MTEGRSAGSPPRGKGRRRPRGRRTAPSPRCPTRGWPGRRARRGGGGGGGGGGGAGGGLQPQRPDVRGAVGRVAAVHDVDDRREMRPVFPGGRERRHVEGAVEGPSTGASGGPP